MHSRNFAIVAVFLVQVFYGINFTLAKTIMNGGYIKPMGLVLARVLGGTILFWLLSLFLKKEKIEIKDYFYFFVAAIFGVGLNMLTFLKGLEYTTPIHASVILTTVPILVLILSSFFLKEKITTLKIIGVILGFCGAIVLTVYGQSTRVGDNIPLGNLLVFINAVSYGIYIVLIKRLTAKYHPFTFIKWLFLFGLIIVAPFGYTQLINVEWHTFTPYVTFSVVFVIVGATFATYLLNPLALVRLKASTVGTFIYLQPVIAGIFAIIMGADSINFVKIIAVILIFAGVYLVSHKREPKTI